jgi:hypothetical protein
LQQAFRHDGPHRRRRAGVLAGREIDKRGDRTTASVLGGAVGALLGRHVERNVLSRRCR